MSNYLITGRSGSGKSTICKELINRGYLAFDGDRVANLAGWTDLATGKRIADDYPGDDHIGKFHWDWNASVLASILNQERDVFLCGNADNATDFYKLFDKVFILTLDEAEQRRRIMARPEHDYGKHPEVQNEVIHAQALLVQKALSLGAVAIDATPEPGIIVDTILKQIK